MTDFSAITAVIVTRGDVDLEPVVEHLPYGDLVIWDNSICEDLKVYGRFAGAFSGDTELVYVQDDDCVIGNHERLLKTWTPGAIASNMKPHRLAEYHDHCLLGWGAIFERELAARAHEAYLARWDADDLFLEVACDIAVSMLSPFATVSCEVVDLPYATDPGRTSTTPQWADQKAEATRRCRELRA